MINRGVLVEGTISKIQISKKTNLNEKSIVYVTVSFYNPLNGNFQTHSQNIYWSVELELSPSVNVYVNPKNSKKYYIDFKSIGKK